MFGGPRDLDTIYSLITPPGIGAIGTIRISGPAATSISKKVCPFLKLESHKAQVGYFRTHENHQKIDEVLVLPFLNGRSFTGEDVVEVSFHGSTVIADLIMKELSNCGARQADRGEFSYRAFMNNKIDLVQAEAIQTLVMSQSERSAKQSLKQLGGETSDILNSLEDGLIWSLAHIEASIDFSTEGIDVVDMEVLKSKVLHALDVTVELLNEYQAGRIVQEGVSISLVGAPNVGKSSLMNLLLQQERSIVTEIAGTTRDVVDGTLLVSGLRVKFLDTAGIRETDDLVESIGVRRSLDAMEAADVVLLVLDCKSSTWAQDLKIADSISKEKLIVICNKRDLFSENEIATFSNEIRSRLEGFQHEILWVSANEKRDRYSLISALENQILKFEISDSSLLSNSRHFELLTKASVSLKSALESIKLEESPEFVSLALREALLFVQQVLGKSYDDQILDRVFKEFCLGK